jgi:hypothetical protein
LKNVEEDGRVRQAIIAANNHYAGFGPGTANLFRDMLGLSEVKWKQEEMEQQEDQRNKGPTQDLKQRTLSDFLNRPRNHRLIWRGSKLSSFHCYHT